MQQKITASYEHQNTASLAYTQRSQLRLVHNPVMPNEHYTRTWQETLMKHSHPLTAYTSTEICQTWWGPKHYPKILLQPKKKKSNLLGLERLKWVSITALPQTTLQDNQICLYFN